MISDAWDGITKKLINISTKQWWMRLENVVEEGRGHIEQLL